jgi:hypothetical protein
MNIASIIANCFFSFPLFFFLFKLFFYLKMSFLSKLFGGGGGGGQQQRVKTTVRTQRTVGQTIRVPRPPQSTLLHASGGGGGGRKQQTKKCASLIVELETFLKSVVGCSDFTIGHFDVTGSDGLTGAPSKVKGIRFKCDTPGTPTTSISLDKIYVCITKPTSVRKYIYVDLMEKKTNYNYLIQQFEEHCLFKPFFVIDRDDRNFVILVYYIIEK